MLCVLDEWQVSFSSAPQKLSFLSFHDDLSILYFLVAWLYLYKSIMRGKVNYVDAWRSTSGEERVLLLLAPKDSQVLSILRLQLPESTSLFRGTTQSRLKKVIPFPGMKASYPTSPPTSVS